MEEVKIIVKFHGYWDGCAYKGGEEELVFMSPRRTSFEEFLKEIHGIVHADLRTRHYVLHCLIRTEDCRLVKSRIKNESDLYRVLRISKTPKVFVTVEPNHAKMDAHSFLGESIM